jgi:[acyl-carrier-protein] S-malonyltransferase
MGFALLFPGQGMQHAAMLPWLDEDGPLVRAVAAALGGDWRRMLADAAWAGTNAHAQALLAGLGMAAWTQLAPGLPPPMAVAAAAGVFAAGEVLPLAQARAAAMDRCATGTPASMLAVSGLADAAVQALCEDFGLAVAIRNGPDSVVLGGPAAALAQAAVRSLALGAHNTPLNVCIPSHTRWMVPAAAAFADVLQPVPFARPHVPLWSAASGTRLADGEAARQDHTLRWDLCLEGIAARRPQCVLEVGPGHALARMWERRYPDIPARSADEFRSAAAVQAWVLRALGPLDQVSGAR